MHRLARSYILSILLTTFMTTCVCAEESVGLDSKASLPEVGDALPHFQLTSVDHQPVELYDILKEQPLILIYYRGGW